MTRGKVAARAVGELARDMDEAIKADARERDRIRKLRRNGRFMAAEDDGQPDEE